MSTGLRLELLEATLKHAVATRHFYRQRIPQGFRLQRLADLCQLPILSREDLYDLSDEALDGTEAPDLVGLTSGTSYSSANAGRVLYRPVSEGERDAARRLFDALWNQYPPPRPLGLRFINANHGLDFFGTRPGFFCVPLEREFHVQAALGLLRRRFQYDGFTERVVSVVAPLNTLTAFTLKLQQLGVSASEFGVQVVTSYAWRLTPWRRAQLEEFWGVPLNDVYSASEVPGLQARRCAACGHFHFSETAHLEFLALDHDGPDTEGPMRLVATSFYPLGEAMPLIRYDTGDVFWSRGWCGVSLADAYELAGRRNDLFKFGSAGLWGSAGMIMDAVEGQPSVAWSRDPRAEVLGISQRAGRPRLSFEVVEGRLVVMIVLSIKKSGGHHNAEVERDLSDVLVARLIPPELRASQAAFVSVKAVLDLPAQGSGKL